MRRLTRHARNGLRHYNLDAEDAEHLVDEANMIEPDPDGRLRYRATVENQEVTVVVAVDVPDLIVTVYANPK